MSSSKKNNENEKAQEQDTVKAMQEEIEFLRTENAYLKKLRALVQEKEQSPNKKKPK